MALLSIENLSVSFSARSGNVPTLLDVSLQVSPGETLGVVGESGSGKSLTARAVMGLLPPGARITGGRIRFAPKDGAEVDIARLPPRGSAIRGLRARRIAMVFQEPMASLSPVHTIGAQVATPLRTHFGLSARAARAEAVDWLTRVRMPSAREVATQYPHQISGGMRQRAMIAIALSCRPRVLICDEPTTALDVTTEAQIVSLLAELQAEFGMAMLFISHNVALVSEIADRVAVMYLGQVVEAGTRASVLGTPAHPYTRGLLRSIPALAEPGERLATLSGNVPDAARRPSGCAFHPRCPERLDGPCAVQPPRLSTRGGADLRCHLHG